MWPALGSSAPEPGLSAACSVSASTSAFRCSICTCAVRAMVTPGAPTLHSGGSIHCPGTPAACPLSTSMRTPRCCAPGRRKQRSGSLAARGIAWNTGPTTVGCHEHTEVLCTCAQPCQGRGHLDWHRVAVFCYSSSRACGLLNSKCSGWCSLTEGTHFVTSVLCVLGVRATARIETGIFCLSDDAGREP